MRTGRPRRNTGELTYSQWYYRNVTIPQGRPSRRKDTQVKCFFCEVFLTSKFGAKNGRKYCDDCRQSKRVKRHLNSIYQLRAYYVRTGRRRKLPIRKIH